MANIVTSNILDEMVKFECAQNEEHTGPEWSTFMPSTDELDCRELENQAHDQDDFILFLQYCVARLDKGETVQAIWHDYRRSAGRR